ncbi:clostripain-related cysteine peptidase [Parabacteroides sp. PF5-9]|uniref:clostripain-related cysteine peptidase n=1 Tax=Parabacteroides sp. PF5-9 TaxID=1742404 RepID=UPI002473B282|nr:clostripain-related cysteine peptidase [Parabacteroides sp. PF5-9]MDH6357955.1 hypothetical protein [Parabacteroides sp. PF5-9]
MKQFLSLLIILSWCLISCTKEEMPIPDPNGGTDTNKGIDPTKDTEQTVFMYMPWSSNLTKYFEQNISDFETTIKKNILKNERVLIFFASSPTKATLFELKYDKGECVRDTLKTYANPAYTTANWITSILNDVKTYSPANRYGMIISCHGMGWIPVSATRLRNSEEKYHWENETGPLTRFFGGTTADYQTEVTTLAEGISRAGLKMEYIMFDDCYMSSIEVAYDLKNVTDYLIASPTEVMAYGFPYHIIGQHLVGKVNYYEICKGFYEFYQNYSAMPCGTIGVTNCAELDNLASVMKEINRQFTFDTSLIGEIQVLDGYWPVIFFDYGDYVAKLCSDQTLLTTFENQLERVIPTAYRMHTPTFYSASKGIPTAIKSYSGITISDPSINTRTVTKDETAWYKATH